jgi:hypothetical protein
MVTIRNVVVVLLWIIVLALLCRAVVYVLGGLW